MDSEHTIQTCHAWFRLRWDLIDALGGEYFSLGEIINNMLESERKWNAFLDFEDKILIIKEEAE